MNNKQLKPVSGILLIVCGISLIAVLLLPLWKIDLVAPQYPEGLRLLIYTHELAGDVDIINGLNHYIGMKTLHTKDFIEFSVLPYLVGFFALAFIGTALLGQRKYLYLLLLLFVCFGILSIYDFWRWEYNYGHNLQPNAAIVVPSKIIHARYSGINHFKTFNSYTVCFNSNDFVFVFSVNNRITFATQYNSFTYYQPFLLVNTCQYLYCISICCYCKCLLYAIHSGLFSNNDGSGKYDVCY